MRLRVRFCFARLPAQRGSLLRRIDATLYEMRSGCCGQCCFLSELWRDTGCGGTISARRFDTDGTIREFCGTAVLPGWLDHRADLLFYRQAALRSLSRGAIDRGVRRPA